MEVWVCSRITRVSKELQTQPRKRAKGILLRVIGKHTVSVGYVDCISSSALIKMAECIRLAACVGLGSYGFKGLNSCSVELLREGEG